MHRVRGDLLHHVADDLGYVSYTPSFGWQHGHFSCRDIGANLDPPTTVDDQAGQQHAGQ